MNRYMRLHHEKLTNWRKERERFLYLLHAYGTVDNLIRTKRARIAWLRECLAGTKEPHERQEMIWEIQDQLEVLLLAERVVQRNVKTV